MRSLNFLECFVSKLTDLLSHPQIQGAILVSSLIQIVIGFSGLVGFVLKYIGPLAIAPTINLIGLSLFIEAGKKSGAHWGIAALWVEDLFSFYSSFCFRWTMNKVQNENSVFRFRTDQLCLIREWLRCSDAATQRIKQLKLGWTFVVECHDLDCFIRLESQAKVRREELQTRSFWAHLMRNRACWRPSSAWGISRGWLCKPLSLPHIQAMRWGQRSKASMTDGPQVMTHLGGKTST